MTDTHEYVRKIMGKDKEIKMQGKCHDCGNDVTIAVWTADQTPVLDHPFWHIEDVGDFSKCYDCYALEPRLTNFRPCEVFTRVVGYLRPVKQFNPGKKAEKAIRKDFIL